MAVVHWFPGHMQKAKRLVREQIQLVDVVIELVDCRCVGSTRNPDLGEITAGKPRVIVMNKADMAQPAITQRWADKLRADGLAAVPVDAIKGEGIRALQHEIRTQFAPALAKRTAKGLKPRAARVMVVGMPNLGKSSLINRMVGKSKTITGARPGVTQDVTWVSIANDIQLMDTPGILLPKIEDDRMGVHLAAVNAVKDEVYDVTTVAGMFLHEIWPLVPRAITDRFGLTGISEHALHDLTEIARQRGILRVGGVPDADAAANMVLREFRLGRLGRISLETP